MQSFTRGATVSFSVEFLDATGAVTSPASAILSLSYPTVAGGRTAVDVTLTQVGNDWTATWDSRVAGEGVVFGHVRTPSPIPVSASNLEFALVTNRANPNP